MLRSRNRQSAGIIHGDRWLHVHKLGYGWRVKAMEWRRASDEGTYGIRMGDQHRSEMCLKSVVGKLELGAGIKKHHQTLISHSYWMVQVSFNECKIAYLYLCIKCTTHSFLSNPFMTSALPLSTCIHTVSTTVTYNTTTTLSIAAVCSIKIILINKTSSSSAVSIHFHQCSSFFCKSQRAKEQKFTSVVEPTPWYHSHACPHNTNKQSIEQHIKYLNKIHVKSHLPTLLSAYQYPSCRAKYSIPRVSN